MDRIYRQKNYSKKKRTISHYRIKTKKITIVRKNFTKEINNFLISNDWIRIFIDNKFFTLKKKRNFVKKTVSLFKNIFG